jgi:polyisoprenoid-binding protein YceI
MAPAPGTYALGPGEGTLIVKTGKGGAAAKAGHNLVIEVTSWNATLDLGAESAVALTADASSLRVRDATGGAFALGAEEKAGIDRTIDDDVLKGGAIAFRSTGVEADAGRLSVRGDLDLLGTRHPIDFDLAVGDDGHLTGSARLKQTDWGIKPYSALFGTLKVADEVEVIIDATLSA